MKRFALICFVSLSLLACSTEILFTLKTLRQLNETVCSEKHEELRKKAVDRIRAKHPQYPAEGLCEVEQQVLDEVFGK